MRNPALTCCMVLLITLSCREAPAPPRRPTTLETYPHAMDRVARLMREEFSAADPVPVEQRIRCESARVQRTLGPDFRRRLQWLQDSLRMEFSSEQMNQLGQRLGRYGVTSGSDPMCRSIDADAELEVPLSRPGQPLPQRGPS